MNKLLILAIIAITLSSCSDDTYTCTCKGANGEVIVAHKIEADKESSAAFECHQKELALTGSPEYEGVKCSLD